MIKCNLLFYIFLRLIKNHLATHLGIPSLIYRVFKKGGNPGFTQENDVFKKNVSDKSCSV